MKKRANGRYTAFLVLAAATTLAVAGEREHIVRSGESASAIARDYYGDLKLGEVLLQFNGRTDTTLRVGERLRVPYCELHLVGKGDTWSGLAQRYLGGASLHPVLALLNDRSLGDGLRPGQSIAIPVLLAHTLQRGESLGTLAEHYYGDPERGQMLQELNRVEEPRRIPSGQELRIPLLSLWLQDAPEQPQPEVRDVLVTEEPVAAQAAIAPERPDEPETAPSHREFLEPLEQARAALSRGEFDRARRTLEALTPEVRSRGVDADRGELALLLASVYIAFDLPERACEAYSASGPGELDPDQISPKIRAALAACST